MSRPVRDVTGLRIAHVIETDGPGGAERVLAHLSTALQAAGAYNVAFLPADGEGWLARQLEGSGVTIEYFRERSEEHTSELQSLAYLVCRLLLEKKKKKPMKDRVVNLSVR